MGMEPHRLIGKTAYLHVSACKSWGIRQNLGVYGIVRSNRKIRQSVDEKDLAELEVLGWRPSEFECFRKNV
mgnify:CR=1 FL=1